MNFEFKIAFRYLLSKRKDSFISLISIFSFLGIALGVATLIIVMSVMNGFRTQLMDKILGFGGHVNIYSYEKAITDYDSLKQELLEIDKVVTATAIVEGQVMVKSNYNSTAALVKGLSFDDLISNKLISNSIENINLLNFKDQIIIGKAFANTHNLRIGDEVDLISPEVRSSVLGVVPRYKKFIIAGFFESGMYEYDSNIIYMPINIAQRFFSLKGQASYLELRITNPDLAAIISSDLMRKFPDYRVYDWQINNVSLFNALEVERKVMFLILTLIILVAAFNIISSLIMLVKDKEADIAILRTFGATKYSILRIFIICGSFIGTTGTLFGVIIGVSFAVNIEKIKLWLESLTGSVLFNPVVYFLSELPSEIKVENIALVATISLTLSLLATIYPSLRAAKTNPADLLRYE